MSSVILTLNECLAAFDQRFPIKKGNTERELLAQFTKSDSKRTLQRWFDGSNLPVGGKKWSAVVFFQLLGYKVAEFEKNRPVYQRAIEMFTLDLATSEEVATAFQLTGVDPKNRMYRVFDGNYDIRPERLRSIIKFTNSQMEDIGIAKDLFLEVYGELMVSKPSLTTALPAPEKLTGVKIVTNVPSKKQVVPDVMIDTLANLIRAMLPLAALVASDTFTASDRALLRERAHGDGVFRLSNILDQLCGERARTQEIGTAK